MRIRERGCEDPEDVPATCAKEWLRRAVPSPLVRSLVSGKREAHAGRAVEVAHRDSSNAYPQLNAYAFSDYLVPPSSLVGEMKIVGKFFPIFPND